MQLPVTLLYDYQSVAEIVVYIDSLISTPAAVQSDRLSDEEEYAEKGTVRRGSQAAATETPSNLLKTLRYGSISCQLDFATGNASGQSQKLWMSAQYL